MSKKVLVIGGSAFTGRVFSIQMSKNEDCELHVVNRGQFPLNLKGVKEYKCDRHNPRLIARLLPSDIIFDVMIDFPAYNPGEVSSLLDALKGRIKQYIVFSTASVYEPFDNQVKKEGDPVVTKSEGDRVSDYIYNKILLERETVATCKSLGIPYTIMRPTFIYGPFSYSARESYFVEMIARGHVVPVPVDATSRFNMVYVFDIARALELCIGNEKAYDEIFNLSAPEEITYSVLLEAFEKFNGGPFMTKPVTVEEVLDENIPLPFPLTEDMLYSGQKFADAFDFTYTPFMEGMEKTYKIFYSLFIS
jgi:nucleoside-diphosphate-sugar epimerase